jgi:7-cyano-7-deazaguanine synthase
MVAMADAVAICAIDRAIEQLVALAERAAADERLTVKVSAPAEAFSAELQAAARVAAALGALRHEVMHLDLAAFGGSALTDASIAVPVDGVSRGDIPVTYVPARNTIMLSLALALAEARGAQHIFFGANAVDYSGYPDCRPAYMAAFQSLANLATREGVEGRAITLHTPIIAMSKAEIIRAGIEHGVDYAMTVSCYQADDSGAACGVCDACRLRHEGFVAAGVPDPTRYANGPR